MINKLKRRPRRKDFERFEGDFRNVTVEEVNKLIDEIEEELVPPTNYSGTYTYKLVIPNSKLIAANALSESNPTEGLEIIIPGTINGNSYYAESLILKMDGSIAPSLAGNVSLYGFGAYYNIFDNFLRTDKAVTFIDNLGYSSGTGAYTYRLLGEDNYLYLSHSEGDSPVTGSGNLEIYMNYRIIS